MRQLTVRQKRVLDTWIKTQPNLTFSFTTQNLPDNVWEELVRINDTEILVTEVERYVRDSVVASY